MPAVGSRNPPVQPERVSQHHVMNLTTIRHVESLPSNSVCMKGGGGLYWARLRQRFTTIHHAMTLVDTTAAAVWQVMSCLLWDHATPQYTLSWRGNWKSHAYPKVDIRLPGIGNSNSHGAGPAHQIISMMKWIRANRLTTNNSLSHEPHQDHNVMDGGTLAGAVVPAVGSRNPPVQPGPRQVLYPPHPRERILC